MLQIGKPRARPRPARSILTPSRPSGSRRTARSPPKSSRSIIYSVARTESAFDQRDKSAANAVGLMQVTPEAGRDTAKTVRRQLRLGPDGLRSRLQHANGRGRTQRAAAGIQGLSHHDLRRLQCRPRPRAGLGEGSMAIRAIPMSTRSTGSSAFRFPKRETTSSA